MQSNLLFNKFTSKSFTSKYNISRDEQKANDIKYAPNELHQLISKNYHLVALNEAGTFNNFYFYNKLK